MKIIHNPKKGEREREREREKKKTLTPTIPLESKFFNKNLT
jgi:hypothetical protein